MKAGSDLLSKPNVPLADRIDGSVPTAPGERREGNRFRSPGTPYPTWPKVAQKYALAGGTGRPGLAQATHFFAKYCSQLVPIPREGAILDEVLRLLGSKLPGVPVLGGSLVLAQPVPVCVSGSRIPPRDRKAPGLTASWGASRQSRSEDVRMSAEGVSHAICSFAVTAQYNSSSVLEPNHPWSEHTVSSRVWPGKAALMQQAADTPHGGIDRNPLPTNGSA